MPFLRAEEQFLARTVWEVAPSSIRNMYFVLHKVQ